MSPEFLNPHPQHIYVGNPDAGEGEPDLPGIGPAEVVTATGRYADNLAATAGVINLSELDKSEREAAIQQAEDLRDGLTGSFGPEAYPAVDPYEDQKQLDDYSADELKHALTARGVEPQGNKKADLVEQAEAAGITPPRPAERSGIHTTGRDSGWPVAGDAEPGPHKDGTGADPHDPVVGVVDGADGSADVVTGSEGDSPVGEVENQQLPSDESLDDLSVKELKALAAERSIDVPSKATKAQLLTALGDTVPDAGTGSDKDKPTTGPIQKDPDDYSADQLRDALAARGLSTDGSKSDLVERARDAGIGGGGTITSDAPGATKGS
jgi:hypothetical protein